MTMTHRLNDVINKLYHELSSHRIDIDEFLFEKFVSGSPERVLKAIESQVNRTLDERDELLNNALLEITTEFTEALQTVIKIFDELKHRGVY